MPPKLALIVFVLFSAWLIWSDARQNRRSSPALWIPVFWLWIVGGRPLTSWLGKDFVPTDETAQLEGSPSDRIFFFALIVAGLASLLRRPIDWNRFFHQNRLVFALYGYFALSIVWSDFPFVSLKRWIKDLGNIVMVMLILTDKVPIEALKRVLSRVIYVLVPISVLVIKYFPEVGRYYDRWTGRAFYSGVGTDKNMLGMVLFVSSIFILWLFCDEFLFKREAQHRMKSRKVTILSILSLMVVWLFSKAESSTALACSCLGCGAILFYCFRSVRGKRIPAFGRYIVVGLAIFALIQSQIDVWGGFLQLLGRDRDLTGRWEIWAAVLGQGTNPLFGTGFYSFWLGDRNEVLSFHYTLGTAHNGYVELYLNNGIFGVALLLGAVYRAVGHAKGQFSTTPTIVCLRLATIIGVLCYAMTEAVFARLGVLWFFFLWALMAYQQGNIALLRPHANELLSQGPGALGFKQI